MLMFDKYLLEEKKIITIKDLVLVQARKMSQPDLKIVDWDMKHQLQTNTIFLFKPMN